CRRRWALRTRTPQTPASRTQSGKSNRRRRSKMRSMLLTILTASALCAGASSCGSRVETHLAFPPVADLKVDAEPVYPVEALAPGSAGEQAERKWWNEVITWG